MVGRKGSPSYLDLAMTQFGDWLQRSIGLSAATATKLAATLAVLVALWLVPRHTAAMVRGRTHGGRARYPGVEAAPFNTPASAPVILGRALFVRFPSLASL